MVIINFYPKFNDLSEYEVDQKIREYRAWLDKHGNYGGLYMYNIENHKGNNLQSRISGFRIFNSEIAVLFKLTFEV